VNISWPSGLLSRWRSPRHARAAQWGCWHYCRSLTASVSVNVWWNRGPEALRLVPCFGKAMEAAGLIEQTAARKRLAPECA
jgi:hypothetical protein